MKKLILSGVFILMVQALSAQFGVLDNTFGTGGIVKTDIDNLSVDVAQSLAVQADGKLIVGGWYTKTNVDSFCLVRYNVDGTVDASFGNNGIVITPFNNGRAVAIQSDGKILLTGNAPLGFGLARYNTNGTLDHTFGNMGLASNSFAFSGASCFPSAITLLNGNRILLGGEAFDLSQFDASAFAVACYKLDGTLDSTFGSNGTVITDIVPGSGLAALDGIASIKVASGKIIAGGRTGNRVALARYETNGLLDNTFGNGGIVITQIKDGANLSELAIQNDNKIVVAGFCTDTSSNFMLARYKTNGALDSTFGTNGIVINRFSEFQDGANALAIQPDGHIVAAGSILNNIGVVHFALARYNSFGSLDNTFGTNGLVRTHIPTIVNAQITSMALQADGKIVVCGNSHYQPGSSDFILARYSTGLPLSVNPIPSSGIKSVQVFPNPAVHDIRLQYRTSKSELVSISLLNMTGQVLQNIQHKERMPQGLYSTNFSVSSLASGIYFIGVSTSSSEVFLKVVKE